MPALGEGLPAGSEREMPVRNGSTRLTQGLPAEYIDATTFEEARRPLNLRNLIQSGALRITYAGNGKGGFTNTQDPESFSIITKMNEESGPRNLFAKFPDKPQSYPVAERMFNQSAPNLGRYRLLDDGKYRQIVESARMLGMSDEQIFLAAPRGSR